MSNHFAFFWAMSPEVIASTQSAQPPFPAPEKDMGQV